MSGVVCGPFTLFSDFDSGNFLKVEYVQPAQLSPGASGSHYSYKSHDHEINIWTRPDCFGSRFENGNRTWFYFSVKGGKPQGTVKLNVLNLNKQVKLFQQGMQPVYRVLPERPEWERVSDRLLINETGEHVCSISFKQRLPDNPNASTLYIAFTFPFSYFELCEFLNDLDDRYLPPHNRLSPLSELALSPKSTDSDIYYHRECACFSFEKRRVELITVTSLYGISSVREDRLLNLFPITSELRPFKFPEKKVVFMSARVHPGETPSSFVLNGFLRFILHPSDPRAILLRRLFVFKFIPILNPDGVVRGHYRTDPRGVNLNRVYLNPSPILHPPIYAARKLLLYYHHGYDCPDDYEYPIDSDPSEGANNDIHMEEIKPCENLYQRSCSSQSSSGLAISLASSSVVDAGVRACSSAPQQDNTNSRDSDYNQNPTDVSKKPYTFVLSESNSLCAGCGPFIDPDGGEDAVMSVEDLHPQNLENTSSSCLNDSAMSHHQCAFEACDEDSVFYENLTLKSSTSIGSSLTLMDPGEGRSSGSPKRSGGRASSGRRKKKGGVKKERKKKEAKSLAAGRNSRKSLEVGASSSTDFFQVLPTKSPTMEPTSSPRYKLRSKSASSAALGNPVNYKISSPVAGPDSGLFLYLDMHGHTTKRGIFMYGNHFPEATTQSECMLLPRLMAVNSPHFDFSACNFTERLMCIKDKRDGASREGSGRVACLKLTGLIRSYTLECNYNTGRIVNPVVTRPPSLGFLDSPSSSSYIPPKYTIHIFEGIGKALAESLLDLTGHNPWSRLCSTEFRSLDGVRRSLVKRLKLSPEYKNSLSESMKKQSSTGFEPNILLSSPPKVLKKIKTKVLVQPGGPLGPKRENQNLPAADAKASGSQYCKKKLPLLSTAAGIECAPMPGCSADAAKEETAPTSSPPKISLRKIMKKKSLSNVPSNSSASGSDKAIKPKKLKGSKKKKSKKSEASLEKLAAKK